MKSKFTRAKWVDPDDAPELTTEFFKNAVSRIGDRIVSQEEFVAAVKRLEEEAPAINASTIKKRLAAVRRGKARTSSAETVFRKLYRRLP
ncbi:hypothetical protein [Duganella sp. BuS-21]|uniref:hypothetical protein n=1 Tax=Duganella sp. BuS-21 TaxID=2943848 RepID=UPI0035A59C2D